MSKSDNEKTKPKKKRRGRGEGSVRWIEEKQLWQARYPVGISEDGKTIYKSIYGKKKTGPGGVIDLMRDALQALGKGTYVDPSDKPLIAWCREWYETYKEATIKANTKEKYKTTLKRLEKSEIANMRLKDLSLELIQKYYNSLKKKGKSEETIRATHSLVSGALNKAEETNRIIKNPARHVIIPKDDDDEDKEAKALTEKERDAFMYEMGRRSHYYMFALFTENTGLRPGEAVALTRADLDCKNNKVKINKTFVRYLESKENSPKTRTSKRIVPVPGSIMRLMKEYMLKQKNQGDKDPLFQSAKGTQLSPRNLLRQFKVVGERIGCPWVNLHTMRHTYASRLFKEKVDIKTISELLGHKKVSTTYDIYVHFIDNTVEESVQVLNTGLPETLPEKSRKKKDNVVDIQKASSH
jgi:integrase